MRHRAGSFVFNFAPVQAHAHAPAVRQLVWPRKGRYSTPPVRAVLEHEQRGSVFALHREPGDIAAAHHGALHAIQPFDTCPDFVGVEQCLRQQGQEASTAAFVGLPFAVRGLEQFLAHRHALTDHIVHDGGRFKRGSQWLQKGPCIVLWRQACGQQVGGRHDPGIHGMQPLSLLAAATAAFIPTPQEPPVNPLLKALLAALGLPESTTEAAAMAALSAIGPLQPLQARAGVATAACTALRLPADATADAVTAACASLAQAGEPDPARFVPVQAVQQLQTQIAALTARQQEADVAALIAPALADGRLLPAMESWARDLGKKDVAALTAFLATAQPIAALAGPQTGGKPPTGTAGGEAQLSAAELAVCGAMGIAPDAYRKAHAALAVA